MSTLSELLKDGRDIRVKLLGDSITHGVGGTGFAQSGEHIVGKFSRNPDGFCWAKLFKEHLESNYSCTVTNNACTGTNIQFIIENFDSLVSEDDDFIICTIGTNNRHQSKSTGEKKSREEWGGNIYKNILRLNELFVSANKKVVFIANIPAAPHREIDGDDFWRILHMDDINAIYKSAQKEAGFEFISMYDLFSGYIAENGIELNSLLKDGLHPNDEGYKVMFGIIKKQLEV